MVFASLSFLYLFLPISLALYYIVKNQHWRNGVLIIFSFAFYAWGEPFWITLLIFSSLADYFYGLIIGHNRDRVYAKLAMIASVVTNLGLLAIFKYSGFIVENINAVSGLALNAPAVSLPIGISFYTFQTLSYSLDVYRGEIKAQRSFFKFMMYVSLYPQLTAGPIVRYKDIETEIECDRRADITEISAGISRFITGLAKKVCLANTAGVFVGRYMDAPLSHLTVTEAWFGVLMFTLQIYFDFSGYSDMAIGLGRMFGFHYQENFNYPYIARSATEFWRRWHMSLGGFFRDYLYIPLGGNRRWPYRNLLIVWFLTGLWHGASWNFVIWGLFFGALIAIERLFLSKLLAALPRVLSHLYLLFIVIIGWTLFYFTDFNRLRGYLSLMFGASGAPLYEIQLGIHIINNVFWIITAVIFCLPFAPMISQFIDRLSNSKKDICSYIRILINAFLLFICTSQLVGQSFNPFLYFRF